MQSHTYYTKYFENSLTNVKNFNQLFNLFRQILLQTNGDVNEALNWMTTINNKYNFTEGLGDFIEQMNYLAASYEVSQCGLLRKHFVCFLYPRCKHRGIHSIKSP